MKEYQFRKDQSFQPPVAQRSNPFQPRPFAPTPEVQTQADQASATPVLISDKASFLTCSIQDPTGASRQPIQPKLTIGAPGDRYEQEADRMATQVVQQINAPQAKAPLQRDALEGKELQMKPMLQRLEMPEEEELQMKPILQRNVPEEDELQMRPAIAAVAGGPASDSLESAISQARGRGQALDPNLQQQMGQAMGADFSGVTIHADSQADQLNRSIQAKAFTTGQDIFFRQGAYQPSSRNGQELIAHELTHVVQQGGQKTSKINLMQQDALQIQAKIMQDLDGANLPEAATTRVQLGEGYARTITTYTDSEKIVGNPPRTLEVFFQELIDSPDINNTKEQEAVSKRVKILKESYESFCAKLKTINLDTAKTEWKQLDNKFEAAYVDIALKKKVQGKEKQVSYAVENNGTAILAETDFTQNRGAYGGKGSHIPHCQAHYVVGGRPNQPGARRIYVKNIKLSDGKQACLIWYSPTHGDRKGVVNDVRILNGTGQIIQGREHVSPWDPRVKAQDF